MRRRVLGVAVTAIATLALSAVTSGAQMRSIGRPAPECRVDTKPITFAKLPSFEVRHLEARQMDSLRTWLRDKQWAHALETYLRQFQPELADWIVYINKEGVVSQCVIADRFAGSLVRDKRMIWAAVFSELPMADAPPDANFEERKAQSKADLAAKRAAVVAWDSAIVTLTRSAFVTDSISKSDTSKAARASNHTIAAKAAADLADAIVKRTAALSASVAAELAARKAPEPDTVDLLLSRRTVVRRSDAALIGLLKGLGKAIGFDATPSETPTLPDSSKTIWLHKVAADTSDPLVVGFARMAMVENAVVQLSLSPGPGKEFPKPLAARYPQLDRIYTNIADVKEHTFELGVLGAYVLGSPPPAYDATTLKEAGSASYPRFRSYVEFIMNVPSRRTWFSLPCPDWVANYIGCREKWRRASLGGFVGTNVLTGSFGDEWVYGATIGHLLGDAGVSIGQASLPVKEPDNGVLSSKHRNRWVLGFDIRF